jgi:RNA polymerase sigma factor (sigma-70 family)
MRDMSATSTDGELAVEAAAGDSAAFSELYDRYFQRVYDYLTRMTRNRDDAAELTQDTFLRAMNSLDQLREPDRFRSWLFAIARSTALNGIEKRKRSIPVSPTPEDDAMSNPILTAIADDPSLDPEAVAVHNELSELVWEAAEGLDERTYTVFDLTVRHGLDSAEIADVMGVSAGAGYTMVSRMKTRVGESIGTYLLMRKGSRECEQLAEVVSAFDVPPVSRSARRSVDRHVRDCDVCERTKKALVAPSQVFGAFAMVAAPAGLQAQIRKQLESEWSAPPPRRPPRVKRGVLALGGVAIVVIAAVLIGLWLAPDRSLEADSVAASGTTTPEPTAAEASSATSTATAEASPTGSATGTPSATATPSPDATATTEDSEDSAGPEAADAPPEDQAAPPVDPPPPPLAPEPQGPPARPAADPPPAPTVGPTSPPAPPAEPPPPPPLPPPPTISLVQPVPGTRVTGTRLETPPPVWYGTLSLLASVSSNGFDNSQLTVRWTSSIDGQLGSGIALLAELSAPCSNSGGTSHLVTGTVTDPNGLSASASVTVIVDVGNCPAG